jgi:dTDP-4-amino-4,6-dideoxygalactose transaminase
MKAFAEKDIHYGIHYSASAYEQETHRSLELQKNSFPIAEECIEELASLPMFSELYKHQIRYAANIIKSLAI